MGEKRFEKFRSADYYSLTTAPARRQQQWCCLGLPSYCKNICRRLTHHIQGVSCHGLQLFESTIIRLVCLFVIPWYCYMLVRNLAKSARSKRQPEKSKRARNFNQSADQRRNTGCSIILYSLIHCIVFISEYKIMKHSVDEFNSLGMTITLCPRLICIKVFID